MLFRHYVFIAIVCIFTAICSLTPKEAPPSEKVETPSISSRLPIDKPDTSFFEEMMDKKNAVARAKKEIREAESELLAAKQEASATSTLIRRANGINILNGVAWYDVVGIANNYLTKKHEIESLQEKERALAQKIAELREKLEDLDIEKKQAENAVAEIMGKIENESNVAKEELANISKIEDMLSSKLVQYSPTTNLPRFIAPVKGEITSEFGWRTHPISGDSRFHSGTDIGVDEGTPVRASNYGVVVLSEWYGGFGNAVIISHGDGAWTLYGHNSELLVEEGETVTQGQVIALAGSTGYSTGPHVHFSMWQNYELTNPLEFLADSVEETRVAK